MIRLSNNHMTVTLLDPGQDRERLGTRYCGGGYIFQITDTEAGDLLTGPTFPDSFNVYDGQGIPDSFSRQPLRDPSNPQTALVIGVGVCNLDRNQLLEACDWTVEAKQEEVALSTVQSLDRYSLRLRRIVELRTRTVRSTTTLENTGEVGFQVSWFPHPFFPQPEDNDLCRLNIPVVIRDNPGYTSTPSGFIARKYWPWQTDHYLALDHSASAPLSVLQRHPVLGLIGASFSYAPRFFPIWGNQNTFSVEPYFESSVAPGQTLEWWMAYDF
jgi:hypothetical protein